MTLLSMNEMTTYRWSLEEDVENYQEARLQRHWSVATSS